MKLPALQSSEEMYSLFGLDLVESFFSMFGYETFQPDAMEFARMLHDTLFRTIKKPSSGIFFDPRFSFYSDLDIADVKGVGFRLFEFSAYHDALPNLLKDWGVEYVRNNYGVALVTISYHPQSELALEKKQLLSEVYDYCQHEDIPCVVDLHISGIGGGKIHPDELPEAQLVAIQELRKTADLFVLEYPGNSLSAATITAELDTDWVLGSREEEYDVFKSNLRDVLDNGGKGALVRETLFREISSIRKDDMSPDWEGIVQFIETTVRDRMIETARIIDETLL